MARYNDKSGKTVEAANMAEAKKLLKKETKPATVKPTDSKSTAKAGAKTPKKIDTDSEGKS